MREIFTYINSIVTAQYSVGYNGLYFNFDAMQPNCLLELRNSFFIISKKCPTFDQDMFHVKLGLLIMVIGIYLNSLDEGISFIALPWFLSVLYFCGYNHYK